MALAFCYRLMSPRLHVDTHATTYYSEGACSRELAALSVQKISRPFGRQTCSGELHLCVWCAIMQR